MQLKPLGYPTGFEADTAALQHQIVADTKRKHDKRLRELKKLPIQKFKP